ncbi:DUF5753 domain-containing protein [Kitasatospora sp. NBC_01560]|uniref:DUF5753 domain-containing protein n=1 Tax=Kitasatospora sp. NBC_01560 TaxID=2975965 RepID=UPI00386504B5
MSAATSVPVPRSSDGTGSGESRKVEFGPDGLGMGTAGLGAPPVREGVDEDESAPGLRVGLADGGEDRAPVAPAVGDLDAEHMGTGGEGEGQLEPPAIDESVLRRPLGGWDVHSGQLRRLLEVGLTRGMVVQVLPLDRTEHAGMGGAFILLTPKGRPQTGYIEVQTSSRLITDQDEVRIMNARYGTLRAQALTPQESLSLIEKMLGER